MPGPGALATDHYELTMLQAALRSGAARRSCTFEVFTRRLPPTRRFGVVAGTARVLEAVERFRFGTEELVFLERTGVVDAETIRWLAGYRFDGDVDGYPEGEVYVPGSPVLRVTAPFAVGVVLETLVLSILNHDCAVASAAVRMVMAAEGRPIIEMGSRRTHESAAIDAARAAYLAGFSSTSNLAAGARYGIPTAGTAAHAFTLVHDSEREAFAAQVAALGPGTTLLVDTYDIGEGIRTAVEVAGRELGAVRIDSGDLAVMARYARHRLDELGATGTRIVVSGDLDEFGIARLSGCPVDGFGVGTAVVTGSGEPAAGFVYKLMAVDGGPRAKRSSGKATPGGAKTAVRHHRASGIATQEALGTEGAPPARPGDRLLQVPLIRGGEPTAESGAATALDEARSRLAGVLGTLPWEALSLAPGEPAFPTQYHPSHEDEEGDG